MIGILRKLSTYAIVIGLVFIGVSGWNIFKERNVNTKPRAMALSDVGPIVAGLSYVTLTGGRIDLANTYSYTLQHRKSKATLGTKYYTPVVDGQDGGKVVYIVESSEEPSLEDLLKEASYAGLLQSSDNLPESLRAKFMDEFPDGGFHYLDSTYKPRTVWQRIQGLSLFFYLLVGGIVVRVLIARRKVSPPPAVEATGAP